MGDTTGLVTGLADSLNKYLQMSTTAQMQNQQLERKSALEMQQEQYKQDAETKRQKDVLKYSKDLEGNLSADSAKSMFSTLSPQFGQAAFDAVSSFEKTNGRPMKMSEGEKYMDPIFKIFGAKSDKSKHDKDQNGMFEKMKAAVMSSRGDPALSDINKQQTAVGMGYRSLVDARTGKMALTPTVWNDVLGQTWKARTGASPTQEVMKDLDQKNIVEAMRKTLNSLSGYQLNKDVQPKVVMDNMLDFLDNTGKDIDERYNNLMSVHLVRDPGFEDDSKYNELVNSVNQRSFTGYTAGHRQRYEAQKQKEMSPTGVVGTEGITSKGTKFKIIGKS